jgi:uncharacterized protein (DUF983 family)
MAKRKIVKSGDRKPVLRSFWRGLTRHCPNCGEGKIFSGYLSVQEHCAVCGNNNEQYPADDAAPYFTIFITGHILIPLVLISNQYWETSTELAVFLPLTLVLTLALLPFIKGGVIGVEYAMGVVREVLPSKPHAAELASAPPHSTP